MANFSSFAAFKAFLTKAEEPRELWRSRGRWKDSEEGRIWKNVTKYEYYRFNEGIKAGHLCGLLSRSFHDRFQIKRTLFMYRVRFWLGLKQQLLESQLVQEWPPNSPEIIICQIWQILGETTLKKSKRISPYSLTDWGYNLKKDNITFTIWFQHHSMEHRKYRY